MIHEQQPEKGRIEPPLIEVSKNIVEEPGLGGPGVPPRIVGIGGGNEYPPVPPTAEEDEEQRRIKDAERFRYMWTEDQYYLDLPSQAKAGEEMRQLLSRSELVEHGRMVVLKEYEQAIRSFRFPCQGIDGKIFGIGDTNKVDGLGIYSPVPEVRYRTNINLYKWAEKDPGCGIDFLRLWKQKIAQTIPALGV